MENILKIIKENNLVKRGDVVAVACSGGSDSMALLHYLKSLESELDIEVIAVHINHSIRENAERDCNFVEEYCKQNGIRFYKFKVDVPKLAKAKAVSLETAGREARYGVFDALVQKGVANKIALAHHLQDQAETILLHLFRGSGLSGMKGMDYQKDNSYIRPMLNTSKNEVLEYLKNNNIPNIEDETNFESDYTRNYIRNEIFPLLTKKWPNIVKNLVNFSKSATEDNDYIENNLNDDAMIIEDKIAKIPLSYFIYENSIINRIIFKALHGIGVMYDIERKHIEMVKELANTSENGKRIDLPLKVTVYKEYDYITLTNKKKDEIKFNQKFEGGGEVEVPNFGKITIKRVKDFTPKPTVLYIDFKKVPKDAVWRFRKEGDVFQKFGGGTKKLKSYLIDKKIPSRERDVLPVLASGNEILAIAGIEISEKVKIEDDVKTALKIEILKN